MTKMIVRYIAGAALAAGVLVPATAAGAVYGQPGGSSGSGSDQGPATAAQGQGNTGTLPFTGGDVVGVTLIGAGLASGGFALARLGRRRIAH